MPTTGKLMLPAFRAFVPEPVRTKLGCLRVCLLFFLAAGPYVPASLATFETAKIIAADGAPGDWFGSSVAISEDGNTVVVGAYMDALGPGSAYVFVRSGGSWMQQAKLTASDGAAEDHFGNSVSISGDTVVVGAEQNDSGPYYFQGSAYVFVKPGGGWADMTETAKLTASGGAGSGFFGKSVAVSGDTVVVGAEADKIGPNLAQGSAYVFVKPGGGWADMTQTAKLTASDGAPANLFGRSVSLSGDTAVVGAFLAAIGPNVEQGSAYVFVKPGGGWADMTQTAKLTASDGTAASWFGVSVAVSGDAVVVGAYEDYYEPNQGSAYVFVKPGGGWSNMTQTAKLTASDGATGDGFGRSAAVSGDTVVVGALQDRIGSNNYQGSTYVFVKPGDGWGNMTPTAKLTASDGATGDSLGNSVALSGDTVVGGAYHDSIGANGAQGSAYVHYIGAAEPPLAALAPHDRSKNRYVSFVPNSGSGSVAFQISKITAPLGSAWVGVPDANGMAPVENAPVTRVWPEAVVHVGDCEIIPVANYDIRATTDGVVFTPRLVVSTIALPALNGKLWGDVAGINNGSEWTPPNLFTNVNDILAVLAYISNAAVKPEFQCANLQAISSADPCLNAFVNTADVLILVKAVAGDAYPFTTNPANCPVCP